MTNHELPTSEWDHSHALESEDEIVDTNNDVPGTVQDVADDGSVTIRWWHDKRGGQDFTHEEHSENSVRVALRDGIFQTEDGLSHELATF